MTTDLDALEALAKAATPGPWIAGDPHPFVPGAQVKLYGPNWTPIRIEESSGRYVQPTRDAEFIAAANPSTVLALVSELRQERERAKPQGEPTDAQVEYRARAAAGHVYGDARITPELAVAAYEEALDRETFEQDDETPVVEMRRVGPWLPVEQGDAS